MESQIYEFSTYYDIDVLDSEHKMYTVPSAAENVTLCQRIEEGSYLEAVLQGIDLIPDNHEVILATLVQVGIIPGENIKTEYLRERIIKGSYMTRGETLDRSSKRIMNEIEICEQDVFYTRDYYSYSDLEKDAVHKTLSMRLTSEEDIIFAIKKIIAIRDVASDFFLWSNIGLLLANADLSNHPGLVSLGVHYFKRLILEDYDYTTKNTVGTFVTPRLKKLKRFRENDHLFRTPLEINQNINRVWGIYNNFYQEKGRYMRIFEWWSALKENGIQVSKEALIALLNNQISISLDETTDDRPEPLIERIPDPVNLFERLFGDEVHSGKVTIDDVISVISKIKAEENGFHRGKISRSTAVSIVEDHFLNNQNLYEIIRRYQISDIDSFCSVIRFGVSNIIHDLRSQPRFSFLEYDDNLVWLGKYLLGVKHNFSGR